jgi:alpha-1,3-rhamnosyltransferase
MEIKNINLPLVSIIVITYNSSKYVLDTLESAKAQTYQNLELIVTDDFSTDDTIGICQKWINNNKERFARTDLIQSGINSGIPANANRGINAARGEYVKLIAGDDALKPNCIDDNIYYIKNNKDVFVLFSYIDTFIENFKEESFDGREPSQPPLDFINDTIDAQQQYRMLLIQDRVGYTASVFLMREILIRVGGFDERYQHVEDYPMWLKLTKAGYKLHFMEKVTVNYRNSSNSITYMAQDTLINKTFLDREQFRRENVYPFLEWKYKLDYWYRYRISLIAKFVFCNKSNKMSRLIYRTLMKWLNPFYYYLKINRAKSLLFRL